MLDLQQHAVARGLVELDVVLAGQQPLELGAVEAGGAADQRHARRVEVELVLPHRPDHVAPADAGGEVVLEAGLPVFRRDHPVRAEHAEIFRDQRVLVDCAARIFSAISIAFITSP